MKIRIFLIRLVCLLLVCAPACAQEYPPLNMDGSDMAPAPKDACYISPNEYADDSIHVTITEGEEDGVHYTCARMKIQHPSQLRAVPAQQVYTPAAPFTAYNTTTARGGQIAQASNAVVAINGDFFNAEKCHVVMRHGVQVRNHASGLFDVLVIDREGNFSAIPGCTRQDYIDYYDTHVSEMYHVFCFGPVLVQDGSCVVDDSFRNNHMISDRKTQRVAIAQIGELEYMIITCDGDALTYTFGMTVPEFARLCEKIGREVQPEGFRMAYNLDGGNSASLFFKRDDGSGKLTYQKLNMPERERDLADMICFVSLVK